MDRTVAKLIIEHFRQKLAQERDPALRAKLQEMLEEEGRKLQVVLSRERDEQPRTH